MKIINPCHKCLVKACCNKDCIEKKRFDEFAESTIPLVCLGLGAILYFGLIISFIFKFYPQSIKIIIWTITFFISYFFIKIENKNFKFNITAFIGILIFAPFLSAILVSLTTFEKLCKFRMV